MPFDYYQRLGPRARETYRRSDATPTIDLPAVDRLRPLVAALEEALRSEQRARVQTAASALSAALTAQIGVGPVRVVVKSRRPLEPDGCELYGRCSWPSEAEPPLIEIWMRTHRHGRIVAFRTFLRTLLHELCHHVDYARLGLDDTFHTEGFFRRESSLMRQLAGPARKAQPEPSLATERPPGAAPHPELAAKAAPRSTSEATPEPSLATERPPETAPKPAPRPTPEPSVATERPSEAAPRPEPPPGRAPAPPPSQLTLPW